MDIRNKRDLEFAYGMLNMCKKTSKESSKKTKELKDLIINLKKDIRKYHKKEKSSTLVKDYGIDGYIELIELPSYIKSKQDADEYFKDNKKINIIPNAYDCTGRSFTGWYKIVKRNNIWIAYHRICTDT